MKKKIMLAANLLVVGASVAVLVYLFSGNLILKEDNRRAVEQCTEEVQRGCPLLYDYVSLLEQENARLNLKAKECDVLIPEAVPPTDTGR